MGSDAVQVRAYDRNAELVSRVQNTVAGLAEEGKLRADRGKKERERAV